MAWFKVDDKFYSNRKVLAIPRRQRLAAIGLWVVAGSWCADHETDGYFPDYMLEEWGGTKSLCGHLVRVGLWEELENELDLQSIGFENVTDTNAFRFHFHQWEEYQPTRAEREDERRKTRERLRKWRARNEDETALHREYTDVSNADETLAPSRPVPSRPDQLSTDVDSSSRKTRLPKSWSPTAEHVERCRSDGLDLMTQIDKFKNHAAKNKRTSSNWNLAFTTWLKKAVEYAENDRRRGGPPSMQSTTDDRVQGWLDIAHQTALPQSQLGIGS